ncbi:Arginyl-tRNA synthetase [Clostridiaceae bacterium JG1575]|nr:Arginyl-tRNA synthetase [Clostridiaceae bacterium JG1575]
MDYKQLIAERLADQTNTNAQALYGLIEIPPRPEMGDYAFPCFALAKNLRKAPPLIAQSLAASMDAQGFEKVEALGPYLNFFLNKSEYSAAVISQVLSQGPDYGNEDSGHGKKILVEYSSPNIAKPFNVALMYTTSLGNALYRMYRSEGYDTVGINHLGDYGTQFGKLICAYRLWGDEEALQADPIKELLRIYVKFHEEAEKDPSLDEAGRTAFRNLESGAPYEMGLWNRFKELSLEDFQKVYDLLDIRFDSLKGEASYSESLPEVIEEIRAKGLLSESQGAQVVLLDEYNMPPAIILKSDGSSIYCTRDITAAIYRKKTYDFDKCLYVVGSPQALHFRQVFKVLELMGFEWAKDLIHVGFGLVKFQGMKFSTRQGNVFYLTDLLDQAIARAREIIEEKNPELPNKDEVARKIGIGGVKFIYLKNSREKEILFDLNEVLSFDGETAPYIQYTYARARSVLRRFPLAHPEEMNGLQEKEEFELTKELDRFNEAKQEALARYEPSVFTRYILDVAKAFNKFYNNINIGNTEEPLRSARLNLLLATCQVLANGLNLLGIDVVEQM